MRSFNALVAFVLLVATMIVASPQPFVSFAERGAAGEGANKVRAATAKKQRRAACCLLRRRRAHLEYRRAEG